MVLDGTDRMATFANMTEHDSRAENSSNGEFSGGFVRKGGKGRPPRVKGPPTVRLANADPTVAQEALSMVPQAKTYPARNHPLQPRKTKLAVLGIPSSVLDSGSVEYSRCVRLASAYKKARQKEIYALHGYVSSGASALLAAASLALSASRFLYEIAASTPIRPTGDDHGLSMPQILKLASSLSDSARQNELSAWELAAREAVVKRRNDQNNVAVPWLSVQQDPSSPAKRGPGRPRKVQLLTEGDDNAGQSAELLGTAGSSSEDGAWTEASQPE